jgi:hypothetical protein
MSDILYDEVKGYKFEQWKEYSVHDSMNICGFFGNYRFLSNFHVASVVFEGVTYPSSEAAYQASKLKISHRTPYYNCSPKDSKKMIRKDIKDPEKALYSADEFDLRKYDIMKRIVFDKFYRHEHLKEMLLDTGTKYLSEFNNWEDVYWGYDVNLAQGENNLGHILMNIRSILKENKL